MSQYPLVLPTTGTVSGLTQTVNMNAALDTLNTLASGAAAPASPEAWQLWTDTTNNLVKQYNGSFWQPVWATATALPVNAPLKFLGGCGITFPTSVSLTVAAGMGTSESGTTGMIWNTAAITKTITANWSQGTGYGALDTGTLASNTWYHIHLISRMDSGAADVLVSLSLAAPTMPSGWTMRRRIGSLYYGAGSAITTYEQIGDFFYWTSAPADVSTTALGATATLYALSVPPGLKTIAMLQGSIQNASGAYALLTDPSNTDIAPVFAGAGGVTVATQSTAQANSFSINLPVNTTQQIRARASAASTTLNINTLGWIDYRGQF